MSVRPFTFADIGAVNALHRSVGWPERSTAGWARLIDNPNGRHVGAPPGWVIDGVDGAPAAFVGNLVQSFRLGQGTLFGATGYSLIVTPELSGRSRSLIQAFRRQPGVFAWYALDANALSAPLYPRFGMQPWPPQVNGLKLSWITNPLACARGRLNRWISAGHPFMARALGEQMMDNRIFTRPHLRLPSGVAVLSDLRDRSRFADFWDALVQDGKLVVDRSPAAMRWRLADPDLTAQPLLLAFNRGASITGFAMAMPTKPTSIEPPVLEIIDLIAVEEDADAIPALMQALIQTAPILGAAKVRLQTVSVPMLARLGHWAGKARREGGWGHCYAAFAPDGPNPDLWAPTPLDGDYAICVRQPPLKASQRLFGTRVSPSAAKA